MAEHDDSTRKITVSIPESLVDFADREAERLSLSRSRVVARILKEASDAQSNELAAEGYRFYAGEAEEFAESTSKAVSQAWDKND